MDSPRALLVGDDFDWSSRLFPDRRRDHGPRPGGRRAGDQTPEGVAAERPSDRRRESRYIPSERRSYLGWRAGKSFQTAEARIENLSLTGAALLLEEVPPGMERAWLYPVGPAGTDWYTADVVAVTPTSGTGCLVRLSLPEPFPYEVFRAVVWGFPASVAPPPVAVEETAAGERPAPIQSGRVLVIDSDIAGGIALRQFFQDRSWDVALTRTLGDALDQLDPTPDWIIVDTWLPDGDGVDLIRELRADGLNSRVAVITSGITREAHPGLAELGFGLVLERPIDFERLFAVCSGVRADLTATLSMGSQPAAE